MKKSGKSKRAATTARGKVKARATTARGKAKAKAPKARAAKASARKKVSRSSPPKHEPTKGLHGHITHTDLASSNPLATRSWCVAVLGWTFRPSLPTPNGDYHLFAYSDQGGGGIRSANPDEVPGALPYIHVADAQAAFDKAISEGAEEMMAPTRVMEGVTIAIVRAPGGVPIGFSGP